MSGSPAGRARGLALVVLLLVLPFLLRAGAIEHGLPRNYVPDTHIVRNALGMGATRDLVPRAGEFSTYPNLLPYCLLPIYAAWYAEGRVSGRWGSTEEFGIHLRLHPEGAHLLARWLVLLFGVATPWVLWRTAREAGLAAGAAVAAYLGGTSLLAVQLSLHERPWVPLSCFLALSCWAAVRAMKRASAKAWLTSVAMVALAFATHPAGAFGLLLPGFTWLLAPWPWRAQPGRRRWWLALGGALVFLALAFCLGYPHLLVHGRAETSAVIGGEAADVQIGGLSAELSFSSATFARLSRVFLSYEPVLLILGLPGLVALARCVRTRPIALWILGWSAYFLFNISDHARYLLPLALVLALASGFSGEWLLRRRGGLALLSVLLALPLVQALRLEHVLRAEDTRRLAEARLAELPPGASVAIDRYGPEVELSLGALERLRELRRRTGGDWSGREEVRHAALAAGRADLVEPGIDALPLAALFAYDERAHSLAPWPAFAAEDAQGPLAWLARLGVTHLLVVDRRLEGASASLIRPWTAGLEPEWVIDPSARGTAEEAFLPTEMDRAWTAIWEVERPGPRLALYRLPGESAR